MTDEERLAAEQRARVLIDRQLTDAGWVVQDRRELNLDPRTCAAKGIRRDGTPLSTLAGAGSGAYQPHADWANGAWVGGIPTEPSLSTASQ